MLKTSVRHVFFSTIIVGIMQLLFNKISLHCKIAYWLQQKLKQYYLLYRLECVRI